MAVQTQKKSLVIKNFRADPDKWSEAATIAAGKDESLGRVLRRALDDYIAENRDA